MDQRSSTLLIRGATHNSIESRQAAVQVDCCQPGSAITPSPTGLQTVGKWLSTCGVAADSRSLSWNSPQAQHLWQKVTSRALSGALIRGTSFFLEEPVFICLILSPVARHAWSEISGEYPSQPGHVDSSYIFR